MERLYDFYTRLIFFSVIAQFYERFLEKYMSCNLRDHLMDQFSRLDQSFRIVIVYEAHFHEFSRDATSILDIEYERVCCFIRGLSLPICMSTKSLIVVVRFLLRLKIILI